MKRIVPAMLIALTLLIAPVLMTGCSKHLPQVTAPPSPTEQPSQYDGPAVSPALRVLDMTVPTQGYEFIGNTFIAGDTTKWDAARFTQLPFSLNTKAGHWYNYMLVRDGRPLYNLFSIAGEILHQLYGIENEGIYASSMILANDQGQAWIWQHPSNLDSLVTLNIEVPNNWSHATRLGVVGTATSFSTYPVELTNDQGVYRTTITTWHGDQKLAVVNMSDGHGLGDSVTVRVNQTELRAFVTDLVHPRHPAVSKYYRLNISPTGQVTSLGNENRWTYGNVVQVTSNLPGPGARVFLRANGLTADQQREMTRTGPHSWELRDLTSWVGPQDARVSTDAGTPIYYGVTVNGAANNPELHHLVAISYDPNSPPVNLLLFGLHHDHTVEQGPDTRGVVVPIGG